jgi:methylenetetrahydrofolate reductase (NADPH)
VSAYPERHPQSPTLAHDLDVLAGKVAAGATRAMTQMFFDNTTFLTYRDAVAARGIDVALVPGIFPIHSFPAVARFASRCGASMPTRIADRFDGLDDAPEAAHAVAAELAASQIAELAAEGVEHVHVYTLNRPELALAVCERLGLVEPEFAS